MNASYWNCLARRFSVREKTAKIFLAVTSSGAVAGWSFWSHHDLVWKSLSGFSALIAVALPLLDYPGQIQTMTKLAAKCAQLRRGYELLWVEVDSMQEDALREALRTLVVQENEVNAMEATLPDDRKLLARCQNEVLLSQGLQPQ
jgi:hypothetical protein